MGNEFLAELFSLNGKTAVVLGGTSGIGQAIARGYAKAGASVVASSRDQPEVDSMARELEGMGTLVGTAILLASQAGSFITGQIIAVDGGFLAKGV